jgi:gamma-glutamylaminecyclotransferase
LSVASSRIFVYGTLKEGFRNFHHNQGVRVAGDFVTVQAFPLFIIGQSGLPWLLHEPGRGHRVTGQVFEVDERSLAAMDALERVDEPGWYARRSLEVAPATGGAVFVAFAYFGDASRVAMHSVQQGPLARYELTHQSLYSRPL